MPRRYRGLLVMVGTVAAILMLAQPSLAFVRTGRTGTTGAHVVTDTVSLPGAVCAYRYNSTDDIYKLRHISVYSPRMKAVPGMGSEKVGWRFIVQRQINGITNGPWLNRYTSPLWTITTTSSQYANFAQHEGVSVTVPFPYGGEGGANYRVLLKMTWFGHDGTSVLGTVSGRLEWYDDQQGTPGNIRDRADCPDYEAPVV